ncbi:MAG: hypothetical protein NC320_04460 [Clostridium sp.]|nr:hypothetical protein [Clostridium sp.]
MGAVITVIVCVISYGWERLWVSTYKPNSVLGYVKHTLLFVIMSLFIIWLFIHIVFLPVDETYSASNIGALGIVVILYVPFWVFACIAAVFHTLFIFIEKKK